MIPKIIHYIWLGGEELPAILQECINSWKLQMPDYNFMRWDDAVIKEIDVPFVHEAIQAKKWAFASDVIRLWALYQYGGIYLDTDVKALSSFDELLNNKAFIGRESCLQICGKSTSYHLTSFCLGAEKGNLYIKKCLEYYNGRHFITSIDNSLPAYLRLDMKNASYIYSEIAKLFGYDDSALALPLQRCKGDVLTIIPPTTYTKYCHHLSLGSWRETQPKEPDYSLSYKIRWRLKAIVEKILLKFNYVIIKLQ